MAEARQNDMLQFIELRLDGGVNTRIRMAEQVDPPGTDGIDIAVALKILQPDPLPPPDRDHRQGFVVFHLSARVPEDTEVALFQVLVFHASIIALIHNMLQAKWASTHTIFT